MLTGTADVGAPQFWYVTGLATFVVMPIRNALVRPWVLALVNLAFVTCFVGLLGGAWVTVGLLACWAFATAIRNSSSPRLPLVCAGLCLGLLFLLYKLPPQFALASGYYILQFYLDPILGAIGFSYVALRLIELLRAMAEQRHPAPTVAQVINYLIPFNMLIAGPITSYDAQQRAHVVPPVLSAKDVVTAVDRIVRGLFKVFVLSHVVKEVFLTNFAWGGWYFVIEMQMHFIWIYLDFSGYTDIAVGLGLLAGISTPENFDRPFSSRNLVEFWERWHMSLAQWLRRNLFIPVQVALARRSGGRFSLPIACVAFTVAFVLCGLWHQFSLRWLAWGALQAVALSVNYTYRFFLERRIGRAGMRRYRALRGVRWCAQLLTFLYVGFTIAVAYFPFDVIRAAVWP